MISILTEIEIHSHKKNDDNLVGQYVVTIISVMPEIMEHPSSRALRSLCLKLRPTNITLSPLILSLFFGKNPPKYTHSKPFTSNG